MLGGTNGILMGSTVVLWCGAERDDKAFLGSLSAKIVTLTFVTCYAISYGFELKELADVQKAWGVSRARKIHCGILVLGPRNRLQQQAVNSGAP